MRYWVFGRFVMIFYLIYKSNVSISHIIIRNTNAFLKTIGYVKYFCYILKYGMLRVQMIKERYTAYENTNIWNNWPCTCKHNACLEFPCYSHKVMNTLKGI